jgi:hypothetical protein
MRILLLSDSQKCTSCEWVGNKLTIFLRGLPTVAKSNSVTCNECFSEVDYYNNNLN